MRRWLATLGFLAGQAVDPPSVAPDSVPVAEPEISWVLNVWANPESCNLRIAEQVDFRRFLADSTRWQGRCIALTGIWGQRRALFLAHADVRRRYGWSGDEAAGRRVGIYAHDDVWVDAPGRPRLSTLVGMVGHCEINEIWGGYCHYVAKGPIIIVAEAYEGRRSATDRLRPSR